jgi:hypothetical protein
LVVGCVSTQGVQDRISKKWVGKSIDEFALTYGAPSEKCESTNGDTAYVWISGTTAVPTPTSGTTTVDRNTVDTTTSGGRNVKQFCQLQIVTRAGTIQQIRIVDTTGGLATSRCHKVLE